MSTSFRFRALPSEAFAPLFDRSDDELAAIGARRMTVDHQPGFPCRVSLVDAAIGETVLLLPFTHHDVASPYRASGPIFVRQGAASACPEIGEIPAVLRTRRLSVRGYDEDGMMIAAECVDGDSLALTLSTLFAEPTLRYAHVHNAGPGCFACAVERA